MLPPASSAATDLYWSLPLILCITNSTLIHLAHIDKLTNDSHSFGLCRELTVEESEALSSILLSLDDTALMLGSLERFRGQLPAALINFCCAAHGLPLSPEVVANAHHDDDLMEAWPHMVTEIDAILPTLGVTRPTRGQQLYLSIYLAPFALRTVSMMKSIVQASAVLKLVSDRVLTARDDEMRPQVS